MRWGSNDRTGISLVGGYELSSRPLEHKPFWSHKVVGFRNVGYDELKPIRMYHIIIIIIHLALDLFTTLIC
jgi:hypothetical protein